MPPNLWYFVTTAQNMTTYLELSSGISIFLPQLIFSVLPSQRPDFNLQLFHRKYYAFGVNRLISKQNFQLATFYPKNSISDIQLPSCDHPALAWSIMQGRDNRYNLSMNINKSRFQLQFLASHFPFTQVIFLSNQQDKVEIHTNIFLWLSGTRICAI